ncbi:MAG: TetR/AcrR family transcriptional regulator [Myxococcales bacterium]|nr:TetR/AcrR family transcriptional regulator [Myxococcales bacterium]
MPAPTGHAVQSRERILDAAMTAFAEAGFAGARIEKIAHAASVNVQMIYYHFASKEGLYREVLRAALEQVAAAVGAAESVAPAQQAQTALRAFAQVLIAQPRLSAILIHEVMGGAEHALVLYDADPSLFDRVHGVAQRAFEQTVAAGQFRALPPRSALLVLTMAVAAVVGGTRGLPLFYRGDSPPQDSELHGLVLDVVMNGLLLR